MVTQTFVEKLRCPACGAVVREIVSHGAFQVGGSSIGPSLLPCPGCGVAVESGLSEWDEKSVDVRAWHILRLLLWTIVGTFLIANAAAYLVTWTLLRKKMDPYRGGTHLVLVRL